MTVNRNKIMEAARKYLDKGQYDRAILEYQKILKGDPSDARVWLKIADTFVKMGELQRAVETYLRVAEQYTERDFHREAISVYKLIIQIKPRDPAAYAQLAKIYRSHGMDKDALQQLELLHRLLTAQNKQGEALDVAEEMVSLDPESAQTRIRLAEGYSRHDNREEAAKQFAEAAELLWKEERLDDYTRVAERLLRHDPKNLHVNKRLAEAFLKKNEPRRAMQQLQTCFTIDPEDMGIYELMARTFQSLNQPAQTAAILKKLAKVLQSKGKHDQASQVYGRVLKIAPGDVEAVTALKQLQPNRGR